MGCSKNSSKKEVYSNTGLPQETRKISNKQLKLPPKGIRKRTKPKGSRRKEIIKTREGINKIDIKKKKKKINKTKSWFLEKINKIEKSLAQLTRKKVERTKIKKIRNERGEITADTNWTT